LGPLGAASSAAQPSPQRTGSAITGMWAWGNAVPASLDYRGLGQAAFAPDAIAAFATAHQLTNVRLSVPWAADEGDAISASIGSSVRALQENGIVVSALGGDPGWVDDPALASEWMTAARSAGDFDSVQLDVEPWTDPHWTSDTAAITQYIDMVSQSEATAHSLGMTLGLDVPWWLAHKKFGTSTILGTLLPHLDSVSIVAFADHAAGPDGVIALADDAVTQCVAATVPFTIGVETDSPAVAGGSQYTFQERGATALEAAAATVRLVYGRSQGYGGVTVEHYLSWKALKP
jgi:hypothetical protein